MALSEFHLIEKYFTASDAGREDVRLGVGDDCALLRPPPGMELAVTTDTLVEGVHFLPEVDPEALGHKALAVNLSDLAAMGAEPAWVTLALALPASDSDWLEPFSRGFLSLAKRYGVQLIGGDTTRGPLTISVTAHGFVPPCRALRRDGARPGDRVYVSGTLGDAALALRVVQGEYSSAQNPTELIRRLERPTPRLETGRALIGIASAAIDISDGLMADLGHICTRSGVGAELSLETIPLSVDVKRFLEEGGSWGTVLTGGDDYELCFTVPPDQEQKLALLQQEGACSLTHIGTITEGEGVHCLSADGSEIAMERGGYEHF
jgi:thiamine-monophosphate kinase